MNRGLFVKAFRETWSATLLFGIALLVVESALSFVLPRFQEQLAEQWQRIAFLQSVFKAMIGANIGDGMGPEMFAAIPWAHPVALAVTWAHAIVFCTRVPSGEVDRGTIDTLLSLPVTRWGLHVSETAAWVLSGGIVLTLGIAGNGLGSTLAGAPWNAGRAAIVLANLAALYLTVGAFAWLMSALGDRRGRAISVAFLAVVAAFLLNYLAPFWQPLEHVAFLSLLRYYQPLSVLQKGAWPLVDIAILGALAAGLWAGAGVVFARRDLCTT